MRGGRCICSVVVSVGAALSYSVWILRRRASHDGHSCRGMHQICRSEIFGPFKKSLHVEEH